MVSGAKRETEIQTLAKNTPLPSFLEVQWSSVRVCDPLLTYKPAKEMIANEDMLKFETPSTSSTRNMALLSPTLPSMDQDLLLEGHEATHPTSARGLLFNDDPSVQGELTSDLWPM